MVDAHHGELRHAGHVAEAFLDVIAVLLDFLLSESGRPVTWLGMMHRDDIPNACRDTLRRMRPMVKRGGVPQMLTRPFMREISMPTRS